MVGHPFFFVFPFLDLFSPAAPIAFVQACWSFPLGRFILPSVGFFSCGVSSCPVPGFAQVQWVCQDPDAFRDSTRTHKVVSHPSLEKSFSTFPPRQDTPVATFRPPRAPVSSLCTDCASGANFSFFFFHRFAPVFAGSGSLSAPS